MLYYRYLKETLVGYCGPLLALLPSLQPFQKADFGGPRFRGTPTPAFSSSPGDTPLPSELFATPQPATAGFGKPALHVYSGNSS